MLLRKQYPIMYVGSQKIYTSTTPAGSHDPFSIGILIENWSWEPAWAEDVITKNADKKYKKLGKKNP